MVRLQEPLPAPRHVRHLNLSLLGLPADFVIPSGAHQQCRQSAIVTHCALGQRYADVTHIKLLEGAGLEQLAPLLNINGRIEIVVEPGTTENLDRATLDPSRE